jgi:hypothetical protein
VDANFTNLNTDKLQSGNTAAALTITSATIAGGTINGTTVGATTPAAGTFTDLTANNSAVISVNTSGDALRITQTGAGNALVVEDSTNPDSSPFVVNASGNVGIGTSSPTYKTVVSGGSSDSILAIHSDTNSSPSAKLYLMRGTTDTFGGDSYTDWSLETSGADLIIQSATSSVTSERVRLDSAGNLGLGVVPSAWGSAYKALQIGAGLSLQTSTTDASVIRFVANAYQDSSAVYNYLTTNEASYYEQNNGVHRWYNAPSGTAGNAITFTQAMTLDASGRLLIGATLSRTNNLSSGSLLQIEAVNSAATGALVRNSADTSGAGIILGKSRGTAVGSVTAVVSGDRLGTLSFSGTDGTSTLSAATILSEVDGTPGTNDMPGRLVFGTTADGASSPTERMRIGSDGLVQLASTSGLSIGRTAVTSPAATDGNVFSGTYTPTLTNTTNIAASTAYECYYIRVGNMVNVSGRVGIDPTAAGSITLGVSLPISSDITNNCYGTCNNQQGDAIAITADNTNNRASFVGTITDTANRQYSFTFQYQVV